MKNLLKRLDEDGSVGADLSPGNPISAAAAARIRELETACQAIFENPTTSPSKLRAIAYEAWVTA